MLHAPLDALEARERAADRGIGHSELARHGDRRQRIAHVVGAGRFSITGSGCARPGSARRSACRSLALEHAGAHVHALAQPVGHERPADARQDAAHLLIIAAQHRQAVERQVVQELDEALLELAKSPPWVPR